MCEALTPHPQYAFMAWCSVKKAQGQLYFTFTLRYLDLLESLVLGYCENGNETSVSKSGRQFLE
jgi:hypothetical protein